MIRNKKTEIRLTTKKIIKKVSEIKYRKKIRKQSKTSVRFDGRFPLSVSFSSLPTLSPSSLYMYVR